MTRPFQFSLRTLFARVGAVALFFGFIALVRRQTDDFHNAAEPIEKATGCEVRATGDGMGIIYGRRGIIQIDFGHADVSDEVLRRILPDLERLPSLEWMNLSHTAITDDGLESLWQLKRLTSLCLYGTKVTADGVERLQKELPGCRIQWQP